MKKLFLLFALAAGLTVHAAAQTSSTALIIREDSSKVLTMMQIANPNVEINANRGAPPITTQNFKNLQLPTDAQAYIALLLTSTITGNNGSQVPLGNNLVILWFVGPNSNTETGWMVTVIPDTGQTGTWLSYTSSLSTTLNAMLDQMYLGL